MTENLERAAARGKARDHFYKRDPVRALQGMSKLTLEERGAYSTLIDLTMARGKPLDDDDNEMAHELRVDRRVWRRVKAALVSKGRIRIEAGKLLDDACMETLAMRASERERAVNNGAIGGAKSSGKRAAAAQPGASYGVAAGNLPPQNRGDPNENSDLFQGGLNQVEVESESEKERIESSFLGGDLTCAPGAPLPPIAGDSPLGEANAAIGNVVPVGLQLAGVVDPVALHFEFVAAAGPRLQPGDALRASVGFIASALAQGCDPQTDMLPVVVERSHGRGGPIATWRYFLEPWQERARANRNPRARSRKDDAA